MKRILLFGIVLLTIPMISWGQNKLNSVRIGAGVVISKADLFNSNHNSESWSNTTVGPSLTIDYSRIFRPWFSLSSALSLSSVDMKKYTAFNSQNIKNLESYQNINHYSWNLQATFRPFYKNFLLKRLELGGGIQAELFNEKFYENAGPLTFGSILYYTQASNKKIYPGVLASGTIHIIENNTLDFSVRYTHNLLKINIDRDKIYNYYNFMTIHILLGVKF